MIAPPNSGIPPISADGTFAGSTSASSAPSIGPAAFPVVKLR